MAMLASVLKNTKTFEDESGFTGILSERVPEFCVWASKSGRMKNLVRLEMTSDVDTMPSVFRSHVAPEE